MRNLIILTFLLIVACPAAASVVASHGTWEVHTEEPGMCYVRGSASAKDPSVPNRNEVYVQVTFFPMMNFYDQVFVIPGYTYARDAVISAQVDGGRKFFLTQDGYKSVAADGDRNMLIAAMREGEILVVRGQSENGETTTDEFPLEDFGVAYLQIAELCNVTLEHSETSPAAISPAKADIGGRSMVIPAPADFLSVGASEKLFEEFESAMIPSVVLLGGFVTPDDMKLHEQDRNLSYDRYAEVFITKAAQNVDFDGNYFDSYKLLVVEKIGDMIYALAGADPPPGRFFQGRAYSELVTGPDGKHYLNPNLELGVPARVDIMEATASSMSHIELVMYSVDDVSFVSVTTVLINNRLVKANIVLQYDAQTVVEDLDWLRLTTQTWIREFRESAQQ